MEIPAFVVRHSPRPCKPFASVCFMLRWLQSIAHHLLCICAPRLLLTVTVIQQLYLRSHSTPASSVPTSFSSFFLCCCHNQVLRLTFSFTVCFLRITDPSADTALPIFRDSNTLGSTQQLLGTLIPDQLLILPELQAFPRNLHKWNFAEAPERKEMTLGWDCEVGLTLRKGTCCSLLSSFICLTPLLWRVSGHQSSQGQQFVLPLCPS